VRATVGVFRRCVSVTAAVLLLAGTLQAGAVRADEQLAPIKCPGSNLDVADVKQFRILAPILTGHVYEFRDGIFMPPNDESSGGGTAVQLAQLGHKLDEYLDGYHPGHPGAVPTIVIHAHGGLVDRCQAYSGALQLAPLYDQAGAFAIFPIYHVGLSESVDKGWSGKMAYTTVYDEAGVSIPFLTRFASDGVGLVDGHLEDTRSFSIAKRMRLKQRELKWRTDGGRDHGGQTGFEEGARYGSVPGLNEGLATGAHAWSYMKWTIDRSFELDGGAKAFPPGESAGIALISTIASALEKHGWTHGARLVLVGHSTGAIYVAKFARRWKVDAPKVRPSFEMILLASALRYDDLDKLLTEDKQDPMGPELTHFRSFGLSDTLEQQNVEGPLPGIKKGAYPRSLLYAVSGMFEVEPDTPLTGMQRFHCMLFSKSIDQVKKFPEPNGLMDLDVVARVNADLRVLGNGHPFVYSPSSVGAGIGFRTIELTHGGFPIDPVTDSSIAALVENEANWNASPGTANVSCPETAGPG